MGLYKDLTTLLDEGRALGITYLNLLTASDTLSHTTSLSLNQRDMEFTAG